MTMLNKCLKLTLLVDGHFNTDALSMDKCQNQYKPLDYYPDQICFTSTSNCAKKREKKEISNIYYMRISIFIRTYVKHVSNIWLKDMLNTRCSFFV